MSEPKSLRVRLGPFSHAKIKKNVEMNEYQFIQLARKNTRMSAVKIAKDQFFKDSFLIAGGSFSEMILKSRLWKNSVRIGR